MPFSDDHSSNPLLHHRPHLHPHNRPRNRRTLHIYHLQSPETYQDKYEKSKDPDRYLRMHETQLILYGGAERMLQKMGLDPKSVNADEIRKDYEAMQRHKLVLENTYKSAERDANTLRQNLFNVEKYLEQNTSLDPNLETHSNKAKNHSRI